MGWDIIAIGTNHKLPIDNPIETAKRLAPIIDGPISIGYYIKWHYDAITNIVSIPKGIYQWEELALINTDKSGPNHFFSIENECARRLLSKIPSIDQVKFNDAYYKDILLGELFGEPDALYEIGNPTGNYLGIRMFNEIVEFSGKFSGRWFGLEDVFFEPYIGENKHILNEFRKDIYAQLTTCGCGKAYYFPDQDFGERLWNVINRDSDEWQCFLHSRKYLENDNPNKLIINMQDYTTGNRILKDNRIICIIDDFSDLQSDLVKSQDNGTH